ncbi:MAG: hypothetical protein GXO66_02930 [Euryarchaeota archaeon]|nr:hypothetical protein [Euryarchaeota archaeon]
MRITARTRVYEVYRDYPRAAELLNRYGICECDAFSTIEKQAKLRKLDLERLLEELNSVI